MSVRRAVACLLVVLGATTAACGGDDDDAKRPAATTTPSTASKEQVAADIAAIEEYNKSINEAFHKGAEAGLLAGAAANYYVWDGTVDTTTCFNNRRAGLGVLIYATLDFAVTPGSLKPASPETLEQVGDVQGRVYEAGVTLTIRAPDDPEPLATSSRSRRVTVLPDGTVKALGLCG